MSIKLHKIGEIFLFATIFEISIDGLRIISVVTSDLNF